MTVVWATGRASSLAVNVSWYDTAEVAYEYKELEPVWWGYWG